MKGIPMQTWEVHAVLGNHTLPDDREAMKELLRGACNSCIHVEKDATDEPCVSCTSGLGMYDHWQWCDPVKRERNHEQE